MYTRLYNVDTASFTVYVALHVHIKRMAFEKKISIRWPNVCVRIREGGGGKPGNVQCSLEKYRKFTDGPLVFCVCSGKISRRRSIVPCGIDDSDLEALRADDASFYGQDSDVSDTDTSDSDHETARAAKRVDRGVEENDEVFSDVDFPITTGTGVAAHPELDAVLDKNSSTPDHRLRFRHERLPAVWRWPAGVAFL